MRITRLAPRSAIIASAVAVWLAATTLNPVAAIANGSNLGFLTRPATTLVDKVITDAIASQGEPIHVALYNGSGERARIAGIPVLLKIVSGTGSSGACLYEGTRQSGCPDVIALTDDDGVATFRPRIDTQGYDYRLVAKADDTASVNSGNIQSTGPSGPFDILDSISISTCTGSGPCSDSGSRSSTTADVTANADSGLLVLGFGGGSLDCAGYVESSEPVTFDVTEGDGRTIVTIRLEAAPKPAKSYEVCFSSPASSFRDETGHQVGPGEPGLLADCDAAAGNDPCVESRKARKGAVIVTFSVPPGDPRGAI